MRAPCPEGLWEAGPQALAMSWRSPQSSAGEGRGVVHSAAWPFVAREAQAHEVFAWRAIIAHAIIVFEAEAGIKGRIPKHDAPGSTSCTKQLEACANESRTAALRLIVWLDRYWPEPKPIGMLTLNGHGVECRSIRRVDGIA